MLRRTKILKNGEVWEGFYYNGRDENGKRKEIPLGTDLQEAKRKWAELECKPAPADTGLMKHVFDRYERDIVPTKAPRTQKDNEKELKQLRAGFDKAPIDAITPQHIAQYRDKRSAKTRANRELALLSHIFNMAREWGYTAKENPCRGVRKNKETPRDFYADDEVWKAVYAVASQELQDAMDIAYLTGQRPADVRRFAMPPKDAAALETRQGKTGKKLRILLVDEEGMPTELGNAVERIRARPRKISSFYLIALPSGQPMTEAILRKRFEDARAAAAGVAEEQGNAELAQRIRQFQFRDSRSKAASETDLEHAQKLLGHTKGQITETVYRRVGEIVKPTK
jgi:integrase